MAGGRVLSRSPTQPHLAIPKALQPARPELPGLRKTLISGLLGGDGPSCSARTGNEV